MKGMPLNQGDSGHDSSLVSEDDSPTPTVERASSEVLYSTIGNSGSSTMGPSSFARTRRSLAEPPNGSNHIYEDIDQFHHQPPMITPISGVPNLKGKAVIRPIAFRPTPSNSSSNLASLSGNVTPTNRPPTMMNMMHSNSATSTPTVYGLPPSGSSHHYSGVVNDGFAPGHPLAKEGRRHYGSSQELHLNSGPPPVMYNKFNSLDRRTLARRNNANSNLKVFPSSSIHQNGPESLPATTSTTSYYNQPSYANNNNNATKNSLTSLSKDSVERRHSSYDPQSRAANRYRPLANNNKSAESFSSNPKLSAMNINGLPDPALSSGRTQVYSSQESLASLSRNPQIRSTAQIRTGGAGTPQFQNLNGAVRSGHVTASASLMINPRNSSNGGYVTSVNLSSHHPQPKSLQSHTSRHHSIHHPDACSSSSSSASSHGGNNSSDQIMSTETPSPSDSAVCDLESMLKEKDTEINYLRETMEQNEHVIFKVYEEKEKMWERELRKVKGLYDNRLRASQIKASKMEQALTNQTYQLQTEKCRLEQELDDLRKEFEVQRQKNEELRKELVRKSSENHPTSSDSNNATKTLEEIDLRVEVKELKRQLERKESVVKDLELSKKSLEGEVTKLKSVVESSSEDVSLTEFTAQKEIIIARDQEIEKLRRELEQLKTETNEVREGAKKTRETFESEKSHWLDEKEKVIRYQKQLQLNYVQMYKRNKTLEAEIEQLTKTVEEQGKSLSEANAAAAAAKESKKEAKVKKSNSVRSKFFKMALHSESHC